MQVFSAVLWECVVYLEESYCIVELPEACLFLDLDDLIYIYFAASGCPNIIFNQVHRKKYISQLILCCFIKLF